MGNEKSAGKIQSTRTRQVLAKPCGYDQMTSLSGATGLTLPGNGETYCVIIPETQNVRYRDDGVSPSATVGMPLTADNTYEYYGDMSAIEFIEQTAGAVINVSFYRDDEDA